MNEAEEMMRNFWNQVIKGIQLLPWLSLFLVSPSLGKLSCLVVRTRLALGDLFSLISPNICFNAHDGHIKIINAFLTKGATFSHCTEPHKLRIQLCGKIFKQLYEEGHVMMNDGSPVRNWRYLPIVMSWNWILKV